MNLPLRLVLAAGLGSAALAAPPPQLVRLWETPATLKVPEGVHFDQDRQVLYVSNIDGTEPWAKDGAGSIGRVGLDGQVLEAEWITGLHAPKGLARAGGHLYVADVDRVIVVDVEAGRIARTVAVPGAKRLNDVTIDPAGVVYATDSETGRIHRIVAGEATVFAEGFKSPNGALAADGTLYVLDQEQLFRVAAGGAPERLFGGLTGHVDGVEQDGRDFLVTCWGGVMYHATSDGTVTPLADTRAEKANAADPGWDAKRRILYVPTFWKNTIVAYRVE